MEVLEDLTGWVLPITARNCCNQANEMANHGFAASRMLTEGMNGCSVMVGRSNS